jgi:hypothetical protein
MATTVTPSTLSVTVQEDIELNGVEQGSKNVLTIPSITEIAKRIIAVPTSEIEILAFQATNPGSGTFDEADVKYIRVTNLDDTNHITLTFKNENDDEFAIKLDKGRSFLYTGDDSGGMVDTMDGIDGTGLTVSLGDLVNITALANTAEVDLELFVAGT